MVAGVLAALGTVAGQYLGNTLQSYTNAKIQSGFNSDLMALQNAYNIALANHQYDLTQRGYRESPLAQRQGLEAAGYNPILAVNNGVSYGSYGMGSSSALGVSGSDSSFGTNAYQNKIQRELSKGQLGVMDSQIQENMTNSLLNSAKVNTEYEHQENLKMDTLLKESEKNKNNLELPYVQRKMWAEINSMLSNAQANQAMAQASQTNAKAQMINAKASEAFKNIDIKWVKEHPYLFNIKQLGSPFSLIKPR